MIVVDVLRVGGATDGADAAPRLRHQVDEVLPDPVAPPRVVLPGAAVDTDPRLLATKVVARQQAVTPIPLAATSAPAKGLERLDLLADLLAVRAAPMPVGHLERCPNVSSERSFTRLA
jgi:hypothetical protein